jgi:hypothetical protein
MNPPIQIPDVEIFRHTSTERNERIKFQNKCAEMSIQVTSGLAVAFASVMLVVIHNDGKQTSLPLSISGLIKGVGVEPVAIVSYFYVLIQLLLLTNYLYHTVCLLCFDYIYHAEFVRSARKFDLPIAPLTCITKGGGWLVMNLFQPLILYVSIVGGLIALLIFCRVYCWALFAIELTWLIVLGFVHSMKNHIREYFLKEFVGKEPVGKIS